MKSSSMYRNNARHSVVLIGIVGVAALMMLYGITEPAWYYGHDGWTLGRFGRLSQFIANNYRLFPAWHPVDLDHPPTLLYLVAPFIYLFGRADWVLRLVPALLSLGTLILTYRVLAMYFRSNIALVTTFVSILIPLWFIYAKLLDPITLSLFGQAAMVYAYLRWQKYPSRYTQNQFIVVAVFGLLTDWAIYFTAFGIFAHLIARAKIRPIITRERIIVGALPFAMFGVFLAYGAITTQDGFVATLQALFAYRVQPNVENTSRALLISRLFVERSRSLIGLPVLITISASLLHFLWRQQKKESPMLLAATLIASFMIMNYTFTSWAADHDFIMLSHLLLPGLIALAYAIEQLTNLFTSKSAKVIIFTLLIGLNAHHFSKTVPVWSRSRHQQTASYFAGVWIDQQLPFNTHVRHIGVLHPSIDRYMNRRVSVFAPSEIDTSPEQPLLVANENLAFESDYQNELARYPAVAMLYGLPLFLHANTGRPTPNPIPVGNGLTLSDHQVFISGQLNKATRLEQFLNPNIYLMPAYRLELIVQLFWEIEAHQPQQPMRLILTEDRDCVRDKAFICHVIFEVRSGKSIDYWRTNNRSVELAEMYYVHLLPYWKSDVYHVWIAPVSHLDAPAFEPLYLSSVGIVDQP